MDNYDAFEGLQNFETLGELLNIIKAMGFIDKDQCILSHSFYYQLLEAALEDKLDEKIPDAALKRFGLMKDHSPMITDDSLLQRLVAKRDRRLATDTPPIGNLWDEIIYEASSLFVETKENKHHPGVIIQRCLKSPDNYDKAYFKKMITEMTPEKFKGFCIHITRLQKFAYIHSGKWATTDEPDENGPEFYEEIKYPIGNDFKRKYEDMAVEMTDKEKAYLENCARIFLKAQEGYDPDEPVTAGVEDSTYKLEYGGEEFEPSMIVGYGYTVKETFESFMHSWFHHRILK